jgi:hypothetical protein
VIEKIWIKLAWLLPRKLAYWAAIRVMCHATQGQWSNESPTDLLAMDGFKRWDTK